MNARSAVWGRALRGLAHGLFALVALISVLLLGLWLYLSSAHGRARLISAVMKDLNRILPGQLTVGRLERLELIAVVLRDVSIRAPAGNETVVAGRVYAALELWSLLHGQLVFSEVEIADAFVDLRFEPMSRAGIASAFVRPAPPAPTGQPSTPPPSRSNGSICPGSMCDCRISSPPNAWTPGSRRSMRR